MIDAGWFVDVALKSAAVAALALLAARLLRRRSAAERSSVLHGGLVAMAVLPFLVSLAPRWQVEMPAFVAALAAPESSVPMPGATVHDASARGVQDEGAGTQATPAAVAPGRASRSERVVRSARGWRDEPARVDGTTPLGGAALFGILYALPALALLFGLAMSLSRLRALRDRAAPVRDARWDAALQAAKARSGLRGHVELLHSPDAASPLSWGLRRRIIVLDRHAVDPATAEALLAHELAHLARQDWIKLLFARFVTALFWFNPFAWWLARCCHQLREEAADDAVLRGEVAGLDYAELLLRFARHAAPQQRVFAAHAIFSGRGAMQHLSLRLARVLDEGQRRAPAMRAWSLGCAVAALAVVLPLAALSPAVTAVHAATPVALATPANAARGALPVAALAAAATMEKPLLTFIVGPRRRPQPGVVQLGFEEVTPRGRSTHSTGVPLAELQGLDEATLNADAPQAAKFRLVRDAGTIACEGSSRRGLATGTCRFTPDAGFNAELARRGVGQVTPREQLLLALQDARLEVLDELARQGYETPDAKRFVEMSVHDVDVAWLRGLQSVGLKLDSLQRLVEFRIHDIDAAYVGDLRAAGYADLTPRQLLEFRIHDVTADTVLGLADAGFAGMPAKQLVAMHIHDVTPAFAKEMKALGYGGVDAGRLVEFSIHDVTPGFVRELAALGYRDLPAERLVEFRIHDVTPAFIREVNRLGYANVEPRDLVAMQIHDVTPAWIRGRLAANGARPSIEELVERRIHGD